MTQPPRSSAAPVAPHRDGHAPTPPEEIFEEFYQHHRTVWLRYAALQTDSSETGTRLIAGVRAHLQAQWNHVLTQDNVPRYAWICVKDHVDAWLTAHRREPLVPDTEAWQQAVSKLLLRELQEEFAVIDSPLGLYTAISRLPERQYEAIVLRYVLGADDPTIAVYLGISEQTVRSHVMRAKERLATRLSRALKDH